jgi:hypothetical protein
MPRKLPEGSTTVDDLLNKKGETTLTISSLSSFLLTYFDKEATSPSSVWDKIGTLPQKVRIEAGLQDKDRTLIRSAYLNLFGENTLTGQIQGKPNVPKK